jgi:peptidoglycan/LPS O-acetylase OafA/YrhL
MNLSEINSHQRRSDIDIIRIVAIALLIIYHICISFQPWGIFFQFIQNKESSNLIWIPMEMINIWRIPILFFISGMGVMFAARFRKQKQLIGDRTKRILLPLVFGIFTIVPIHNYIFQLHYSKPISYNPHMGHLWFLCNIYIYFILLWLILFIKKFPKLNFIKKITNHKLSIYLFALAYILESIILKPESFKLYLLPPHGFYLGLVAFFTGALLIKSGNKVWEYIHSLRYVNLIIAFGLYLYRFFIFEFKNTNYLTDSVESILWIFAILGFAYTYRNIKSKKISYLSRACYPIYIIHMICQYFISSLIFKLEINIYIKLSLTVILTFSLAFILYELIRRIKYFRILFGMK